MVIPFQHTAKIQQQQKITGTSSFNSSLLSLRDKPFYIRDKQEHREQYVKTNGNCCFNHIAGLPLKDGRNHPLYDYERLLCDTLFGADETNNSRTRANSEDFKDKHLWVLKSTGLGITELFLRVIGWLCTKDDRLKGSQICIVTGPRIELSVTLIDRLKALFYSKLGIIFANKETVLELNGVRIEVYPSHHLDSMRGLANVSFILLDEADFFPPGQQKDARDISERYIGKSNPYIVLTSTPNRPGSLFDQIEKEKEQECIYQRIKLDYTYGLGKIYTKEEIDKARQSPSFEREYNLKYLGIIGNTFHTKDIDRAVLLGKNYDPNVVVVEADKILGIDVGWGSSAFGLCLLQVANSRVEILLADEYERPRYTDMVDMLTDLLRGLHHRKLDQSVLDTTKVYVDGSSPEFVTTLKELVGETTRWDKIHERLQYCKDHNLDPSRYMQVVPVAFSQEGRNMIKHTKELLEFDTPLIAINSKFDKLITALRTAISSDDGKLDKEQTSFHNVLDALRLALKGIKIVKKESKFE